MFELSKQPKILTDANALFIVVAKDGLLHNKATRTMLFTREQLNIDLNHYTNSMMYLGDLHGKPIYSIQVNDTQALLSELHDFTHVRYILEHTEEHEHTMIFRAFQLNNWDRHSQYCGCCGGETAMAENEYVKQCQTCSHLIYPEYSPAVIMLITDNDRILLGRTPFFDKGVYSTLAGFVEAGETCEAAVHREIKEEVGIQVKNLQHQFVQPWPFPRSLMFGYRAEFAGGEICVDKDELEDARWFNIHDLPKLPPKGTISNRLILSYVDEKKN